MQTQQHFYDFVEQPSKMFLQEPIRREDGNQRINIETS